MDTRLQTSFGDRCRQLRRTTGLSQEKFAYHIGMDRSYYASIETGTRNVTLSSMAKIAKGLGITMSELLIGVDTEESSTSSLTTKCTSR